MIRRLGDRVSETNGIPLLLCAYQSRKIYFALSFRLPKRYFRKNNRAFLTMQQRPHRFRSGGFSNDNSPEIAQIDIARARPLSGRSFDPAVRIGGNVRLVHRDVEFSRPAGNVILELGITSVEVRFRSLAAQSEREPPSVTSWANRWQIGRSLPPCDRGEEGQIRTSPGQRRYAACAPAQMAVQFSNIPGWD